MTGYPTDQHRVKWWAYTTGTERIRRTHKMVGAWSFDVTCSCGWETITGGAVRSYIEQAIWYHRFEVAAAAEAGTTPEWQQVWERG